MDMIQRALAKTILETLKPGFITVIYGPRRVGKTVLLNQLSLKFSQKKVLMFNGDTQETRDLLGTTSEIKLTQNLKNSDMVIIDEAQRIPNIALALKIIIDKFPKKNLIITGSTSLALARGVPEALTGRTIKFRLYPLSTAEITQGKRDFEKPYFLEEQLIFGGYPYLQNLGSQQEKKQYLHSIIEDYLFRDILELQEVTAPEKLRKLAILLAFQIGAEVSLNELADNLKIDVKTVDRYLTLLKLGFIVFEIGSFAKNLRKEIAKSKKYYFWDLGIRNALINQFMPLDVRNDLGGLWENFLVIERLKNHECGRRLVQAFFWRTYEKAEVDWLEIQNGKMSAFEFKWQSQRASTPKVFKETYNTQVEVISKDNYLAFVGA